MVEKKFKMRGPKMLGGLIVLASSLVASPIPIANYSFETLGPSGLPAGCGTGCFYNNDNIPDWVVANGSQTGQFQPGTQAGNFNFFSTLSDGITVAYTNGGTLSQTVAPTVQLGTIYTLMVDVGVRHDIGNPGTVELVIGGTPILATGVAATPGNWSTYVATYTGLAGDVGESITVRLSSPTAQGNWDNVRLDATGDINAVPEPAAMSLMGIGFTGLALLARRRRS